MEEEFTGLVRGKLEVMEEPFNWRGNRWVRVKHIERPDETNNIHLSWWIEGKPE